MRRAFFDVNFLAIEEEAERLSARGAMYIYIPNSDLRGVHVYFLPDKGNSHLKLMLKVWNIIKLKNRSVEISTI